MRGLVAVLIWVLAAHPLLAEVVTLSSGEHSGFSRIAMRVASPQDWVFGRVDGGYELRSPNREDSFDLSSAFDRIPRTRIADVIPAGEGALRILSTCDCHLEVVIVGSDILAVDVVDGPADGETARFNERLDDTTPPTDVPIASGDRPDEPTFSLPLLPFRTPLPLVFGDPLDVATTPEAGDATETRPSGRQTAEDTEAALLEQIARAAAQGLLDADVPDTTPEIVPPLPTTAPAPPDPLPPAAEPIAGGSHVSITTSIDEAARDNQSPRTSAGKDCLPDYLFDISAWGEEPGAAGDIGAYRSDLVGEFDEIDGEGLTALVRHYLYITFGAEALSAISRYADDITRPDLLAIMAEVMDDGSASTAALLADQLSCEGKVALWAVAAQPELFRYQEINTGAVKLEFAALPAHLRRHLGPILATRFQDLGDADTARAIKDATLRILDEASPGIELLDARAAATAGRTDEAVGQLDALVPGADDTLPSVLIERVEATLAAGGAVPEDLISLIQSVGFEHRGTAIGIELALAEIRAQASALQFGDAFDRLDAAMSDGTVTGDTMVPLSEEIYSILIAQGGDDAFLTFTFDRLEETALLSGPIRTRIADRLVALGFPAEARFVLPETDALPPPEDRLLLARIAVMQDNPGAAIGYLAGLDDPAALQLRADAFSAAKDRDGARMAYAALGDVEAAQREAWTGGLWDYVATEDTGPRGEVARLLSAPATDAPDAATPLARDQSLVAEAERTRALIETLLSDTATAPDASQPQPQ